jgi:RNA polymerase sigma-70 factor (ECF subfamily)
MSGTRSRVDLDQLVLEHHQAVYRYGYRLTGSVQDAEDLTQQVFLAAHRKIGQLRNIDKARSWLFAILRNRFFREQGRRRPVLAADLSLDTDLLPTAPPPEAVDGDRLQQALNQLPDAFRLMVVMFYFEECSYREIAERLDVPIGTVMSRLARAKGYLRSAMSKGEPGPRKEAASVAAKRG